MKLRICPRLINGDVREDFHARWPPEIKDGIRAIAKQEGQSINWVIEQVVIRYFKLPQPEYKTNEKTNKKTGSRTNRNRTKHSSRTTRAA